MNNTTAHAKRSKIVNQPSKISGFTLIELLIVIGIILILIGILLPTVGRVREAAQTASTRQMLARIEAGIQTYYNDFQSYPGPFANGQLLPGTATTAINGFAPTPANVTSSENLMLALAGGLKITVNASNQVTAFAYDAALLDPATGPANLNPAALKRFKPYISIESADTTLKTTPRFFPTNAAGLGGSSDTVVPEFLDKYPSPMPILYLRAMRGNTGIIASNNNVQYNFGHLAPYGFTSIDAAYPANATADGSITRSYAYFGNPAIANMPLQKDAFMLISAGPDGRYGTLDDVVNFR